MCSHFLFFSSSIFYFVFSFLTLINSSPAFKSSKLKLADSADEKIVEVGVKEDVESEEFESWDDEEVCKTLEYENEGKDDDGTEDNGIEEADETAEKDEEEGAWVDETAELEENAGELPRGSESSINDGLFACT